MFAKFGLSRGTIFGKGGPLLAAKIGPGDHFWEFFCQNRSRDTNFGGDMLFTLFKFHISKSPSTTFVTTSA